MADSDVPMHKIESIVTPDKNEFGVGRMRVPGGWMYWLQPMGGTYVYSFVPDVLEAMPLAASVSQIEVPDYSQLISAGFEALRAEIRQIGRTLADALNPRRSVDPDPAAAAAEPVAETPAPAAAGTTDTADAEPGDTTSGAAATA